MKALALFLGLLGMFMVGVNFGNNLYHAELLACNHKTTHAELAIRGCEIAASGIEREARAAEREAKDCKEDFNEFQRVLNGDVPSE